MAASSGKKFRVLLLSLFFVQLVLGIYEDQAGTYDWRLQYVGKPIFMDYIQASQRVIVATEQNVIAAINAKNGRIGWRQVLEKGTGGRIDGMLVDSSYVVALLSSGQHVRSFNAGSGTLQWEVSLPSPNTVGPAKLLLFPGHVTILTRSGLTVLNRETGEEKWTLAFADSGTVEYLYVTHTEAAIYVIGIVAASHVKVVTLGEDGKEKSSRHIPAAWITLNNKCATSGKAAHLVCVDKQTGALHTLDLATGTTFSVHLVEETRISCDQSEFIVTQSAADLLPVLVLRANSRDCLVLTLNQGTTSVAHYLPGVTAAQVFGSAERPILITLSRASQPDSVNVNGYNLMIKSAIADMTRTVKFPAHHGLPLQMCGVSARVKDGSTGYHMLALGEDHSLTLFSHTGKVSWVREEALASILSVEMVDLPVSQIMAKMEDEFGSKDDIWTLFVRRFRTQFSQLVTFVLQLKHRLKALTRAGGAPGVGGRNDFSEVEQEDASSVEGDEGEGVDEDYLTRDDFNLHKMIVVVTAPGKIFGLDSVNGQSIWRRFLPNVASFEKNGERTLPLYVQRTTAHFPHQPLCTLLGRDRMTHKAVLYSFHPISGAPMENAPAGGEVLDYEVINAVMLSQMDDQFQHPLVLLDSVFQYHVYPASATALVKDLAPSLFTFVADVDAGLLRGYRMRASDGYKIAAEPLWTVDLSKNVQTITKVVSKPALERVHSQGIVLDDRSVLYKYINPNLVTVVTEGDDPVQKSFSVYLVDTVSGNLVFHCAHKKSSGPIHLVHSENWITYSYWNEKARRVELAVLELYEGSQQSNATAFSSFHPPPPPIVMKQAYIFPAFVSTIATTVTEKGITSKELIFALESGGILTLPKILIDPRRPDVISNEPREEGSQIMVPYMPELPKPPQNMINYHQTVFNIRGIHTAPAGLESTSLVFCYGLDIFYTRVTPSKMFDVLKEDFDYFFISSVLIGMIAVSVVSQKLASRRALNKAWK